MRQKISRNSYHIFAQNGQRNVHLVPWSLPQLFLVNPTKIFFSVTVTRKHLFIKSTSIWCPRNWTKSKTILNGYLTKQSSSNKCSDRIITLTRTKIWPFGLKTIPLWQTVLVFLVFQDFISKTHLLEQITCTINKYSLNDTIKES